MQLFLTFAALFALTTGGYFLANPAAFSVSDPQALVSLLLAIVIIQVIVSVAFVIVTVLLDRPFFDSFSNIDDDLPTLRFVLRLRISMAKALLNIGSTMILMGFSLLPLSVLLLAIPAVNPSEAVLTVTPAPSRSLLRNFLRRVSGLATA